eukprot:GHVS01082715.1.p1 GENE.GHVS01082715.1~~GHVS01082715.1.p1  ORF type:complete len:110 (+),score=16.19 GHVS01082715.1:143-472(+)
MAQGGEVGSAPLVSLPPLGMAQGGEVGSIVSLVVDSGEMSVVQVNRLSSAAVGTTPVGTTPVGTTPVGTTPVGTTQADFLEGICRKCRLSTCINSICPALIAHPHPTSD